MNYKHGMSESRVFKIWLGILRRCSNDADPRYGGRGIRVCARWAASFEAFFADMGHPPSNEHSIDRADVNGDYQPANCRWATREEQARNTTRNTILTLAGKAQTIAAWSEQTGIKPSTICVRLYELGWSVERALTTAAQPRTGARPWIAAGMSRSSWYRSRRPEPTPAPSPSSPIRNIDALEAQEAA